MSEEQKNDFVRIGSKYVRAPDWWVDDDALPPQTCPHIDSVLKCVGEAYKVSCKSQKYDDIEDLKKALSDIEYELSFIEDEMEMIRAMNSRLRDLAERE